MTNNLKDYSDILDSSVDKAIKLAANDPHAIIAKSSLAPTQDIRPKNDVPKTIPEGVLIVKGKSNLPKGNEDAPFLLIAEDETAKFYSVHDYETDEKLDNLFYANRHTGTTIEYATLTRWNNNGEDFTMLQRTNRKIYFNRID